MEKEIQTKRDAQIAYGEKFKLDKIDSKIIKTLFVKKPESYTSVFFYPYMYNGNGTYTSNSRS